ncbi:hypothetical protein V8E51_016390 [Hyaloscypha variabilis]
MGSKLAGPFLPKSFSSIMQPARNDPELSTAHTHAEQETAPQTGWELPQTVPHYLSSQFITRSTSCGFSSFIIQQVTLLQHAVHVPKKADERSLRTCDAATLPFWPEARTLQSQPSRETPARLQDMHSSPQLPLREALPVISIRTSKDPEVLTRNPWGLQISDGGGRR